MIPLGGDVYAVASVGTGMVLDAGGFTAGARVVQSPWTGALSQWWRMVPFSKIIPGGDPNSYVFISMHSSKVIDVAMASTADGSPLVQWTWKGAPNQIWVSVRL